MSKIITSLKDTLDFYNNHSQEKSFIKKCRKYCFANRKRNGFGLRKSLAFSVFTTFHMHYVIITRIRKYVHLHIVLWYGKFSLAYARVYFKYNIAFHLRLSRCSLAFSPFKNGSKSFLHVELMHLNYVLWCLFFNYQMVSHKLQFCELICDFIQWFWISW